VFGDVSRAYKQAKQKTAKVKKLRCPNTRCHNCTPSELLLEHF